MIGAALLVAMVAVALELGRRIADEPAVDIEVATCARCGRRGLDQRWLAWHHEATHAAEEVEA